MRREIHAPIRWACTLLTASSMLWGCAEPRPAVIGYAFPVSGTPTVEVARATIADLGDAPPIRIVYDSVVSGDPADVEVERAQRFVNTPGIVGVVGHGGSRGSLAAAPVYNEAGIPQIVPMGTSRLLALAGPWTFMLVPDDSLEGAFIGEFAAERLRARSATMFYVNDEYGLGLRNGVVEELNRRGVSLVDVIPIDPTSDFATLVDATLRRGTPDVVITAARPRSTGSIARLLHERNARIPVVAGDGSLITEDLSAAAGPAIDSIYIATFWLPDPDDPDDREFAERFRRVMGRTPDPFDGLTHDALMLLTEAVREVGSDPGRVRDYLSSLGVERPPYPGVTGPISFAPDRRERLVMARIVEGMAVRVVDQ